MVHCGGLMANQHILLPWPQWLVQGWVYGPSQANQSQFWKKSLSAGAAEDHVAPACKEPGRMKPTWRQHRGDVLLDPDDIICSRDPACLELELSPHFQCTSHKVPSYVESFWVAVATTRALTNVFLFAAPFSPCVLIWLTKFEPQILSDLLQTSPLTQVCCTLPVPVPSAIPSLLPLTKHCHGIFSHHSARSRSLWVYELPVLCMNWLLILLMMTEEISTINPALFYCDKIYIRFTILTIIRYIIQWH